MKTSYLLSGAGFTLLTLVFFGILFIVIKRAIDKTNWEEGKKTKIRNRFLFVVVLWAAFVSISSISGYTGRFDLFPLNAAPFLLIPLALIIWASLSASTKEILEHVPVKSLLYLQVFRVFVELLLWSLFIQQLAPIQMTFEGRNLDIFSGILGPVAALLLANNRKAIIGYNVLGLALLINIVGVALLSMPTPFRLFTNEPANTIVMEFGFVFLPTFLVPLAYGLHFLSLRQMSLKK
jgi:hypothetical protein